MANFTFRDFPYIPTLTAMESELKAYGELYDPEKKAILPVWTVGRVGQALDVHQAAGKAAAAVGEQRFVMRLDETVKQPGDDASEKTIAKYDQFNAYTAMLLDPADGYANWRSFVANYDAAIPCLPSPDDQDEYVAAAKAVVKTGSALAFWVDATGHQVSLGALVAALQGISHTDDCLVIVDFGKIIDPDGIGAGFGKIRKSLEESLSAPKFAALTFVATGTSFEPPAATGLWSRRIRELDMFDACGGFAATQYGDYGSVALRVGRGRWVGRVDYAKPTTWIMWRGERATKSEDYKLACQALKASGHMDKAFETWGTKEIIAEADHGSPGHWISVRVNIHLTRQLRRAALELARFRTGDTTPPERLAKDVAILRELKD